MHPLRATTVDILGQLVGFDTTSHLSNLAIIDHIEGMLSAQGIRSARLFNDGRTKASLVATIGPEDQPGIVLSGHTDVVPVKDQIWQSEPFAMEERDGKLYGRGTADMKGFIACALACVPQFKQSGKTIHLAFSYDEEVGCLGAPQMGQHLANALPVKPKLVVVGEPTLMQVIDAHKGAHAFITRITGVEGHSSKPHLGVNAVQYGARIVGKIEALFEAQKQKHKQDARFDPPYTTLHVGIFHGGTARNIIPATCEMVWEIRSLPGTDIAAILQELEDYCDTLRKEVQCVSPKAGITTTPQSSVVGLAPMEPSTCLHHTMHAAGTNHTGAVSYATEAGVFQHYGLPTLICGPGSIDQAHKPDEFVELSQLDMCLDFLKKIIA